MPIATHSFPILRMCAFQHAPPNSLTPKVRVEAIRIREFIAIRKILIRSAPGVSNQSNGLRDSESVRISYSPATVFPNSLRKRLAAMQELRTDSVAAS